MGIEKCPKNNKDDQSEEDRRRTEELRQENAELWREAAEVDRELEVAVAETQRLKDVLASREQDVQRLRELVAQQRHGEEKRSEWKQMVAQKVEMAENKDEVQKEMDGIRHSELKVSLLSHMNSMKAPNSKIFEMLDQAIEYVNEKEDTTEKDIKMLEQTKKDIEKMDDEAPSREVLKKMYENLIEIADVFGNPATASCAPPSAVEHYKMVNTAECSVVLKSRLANLIEIMEIERKHPELLDLASAMDGLSLSDSIGATGVSNPARKNPK